MIYPQKLNSKNGEKIFRALLAISIFIAVLLVLINKLTTPKIHWAALANCGILYIWVTVIYSIKRNANIAAHVLLQMLAISGVAMYVDNITGSKGWAVSIAIPIILIVANITMLTLTIINYNRFIKYAIYQLFIVLISLIPIIWIVKGIMQPKPLVIIAILISIFSLSFSIILCYKDIKEAIIRKLHM